MYLNVVIAIVIFKICPGIGVKTNYPKYVEQVKALASMENYSHLKKDSSAILDLVKDTLDFICEGKYALL